MKLPSKVKVGPYTYSMQKVSRGSIGGSTGQANLHEFTIGIADDVCDDLAGSVAVHEYLHAGWYASGLINKFRLDQEEEVISNLETYVTSLIRDNPQLIKFIQGKK